jgi:hypothetical protein
MRSVGVLAWKRGGWVEVEESDEEFDYELTRGYFARFLVRVEKRYELNERSWTRAAQGKAADF